MTRGPLVDILRHVHLKEVQVREGQQGPVSGLAFAPDGGSLVSAGADRVVRLWDGSKAREVRTFPKLPDSERWIRAVAYAPDGKQGAPGAWLAEEARAARRRLGDQ